VYFGDSLISRFGDLASTRQARLKDRSDNMLEAARELERRTKAFGIAVLKLLPHLPKAPEMVGIRHQLGKSSTSVAANYRATCRSRSRAEFLSRLNVVLEEADESVFWLEVITEGNHFEASHPMRPEADRLLKEAQELRSIFSASVATVRRGRESPIAGPANRKIEKP
jgi:four helix bundle protein